MIAAALRGALSDRARGGRIHVIDSLSVGDVPSTKTIVELLNSIATSKHVLVVLERDDAVSHKSVRNIPSVHVLPYDQLNAYDVLVSDDIVFTKGAFDGFVAGPVKSSVVVETEDSTEPVSKKRVSPERAAAKKEKAPSKKEEVSA
jgi:large subunit ribosomal protein L4